MSSAIGASLTSNTSVLIYNPPGTTHQNRFRGGRARFVANSGGEGSEEAALCLRDPYAVRLAHSVAHELAGPLLLRGRRVRCIFILRCYRRRPRRKRFEPMTFTKIGLCG